MEDSVVVFASKRVGYEILSFLLERQYKVVAVIVAGNDDKEIFALCERFSVPIYCFDVAKVLELLRVLGRVAWCVNAWSAHYLCAEILECFAHRINVHPSYAPYCLGNDNAAWAIMENRSMAAGGGAFLAGVCLLEMTENIDEGGIYAVKEIVCEFGIKGKELHEILMNEAIGFFKECWEDIFKKKILPKEQKVITKYTRKQTDAVKYLDAKSYIKIEDFVLRILANDFSPRYTSVLRYEGREYAITLEVKAI